MKQMTEEQRKKINLKIQNGQYIDDLIEGYSIKGEDLSYAKIKKLIRPGEDISKVKLQYAIIEEKVNLISVTAHEVNFLGLRIECKGSFESGDFRHSDFRNGFFPYIKYSNADFRDVKFCDSILPIGGTNSRSAKFDRKILKEFIGLGRL